MQLPQIAQEASGSLGIPAATLALYLANFIYRLGPAEEEAITRFTTLANAHHLL